MSILSRMRALFQKGKAHHDSTALHRLVNKAARQEWLFADCRIPDTLDGRFEALALHAVLAMHAKADAGANQALFDQIFIHLDPALREAGVSDMSLAKRMKKFMERFNERLHCYLPLIDVSDEEGLQAALLKRVYDSNTDCNTGAEKLSAYTLSLAHGKDAEGLTSDASALFFALKGEKK